MITRTTGTRQAYDFHVLNVYYPDHDEIHAITGTRAGCVECGKKALMEGARYCQVAGCFYNPDGDLVEIVRETMSL